MSDHLRPSSIPRATAISTIAASLLVARPLAAQPAPPVVRIGAPTIDASGEAFYGTDAGIFQANGVTPQTTVLANGGTAVQAVVTGDIDAGEANPMSVAIAVARGIPLQVLASASLYSRRDANPNLVVAKNSPIKVPKDLAGATIGTASIGDFNQVSIMRWLDANGVSRTSVKFVELPLAEVGVALQRNTVQAGFLTEPFKSAALTAGLVRDFGDTYLAVGPEIAAVVWFAARGWVQKNPDVAKRFVNGIYATAKWANAHPAETAAILAKVSKQDPAVVASMTRFYFATQPDRRYLESVLAVAQQYGALQRPVSYDEFVGN